MARGVFVAGTDTGVGKTWVAAHLVRALRARGRAVHPYKPVESGLAQLADARDSDAGILGAVAGIADLQKVSRFRLARPLAPPLAAEREGVELRMREVADFCRCAETAVVEGAGGWRSPLTQDGDVRELASRLGLSVLLVAADRLGAISQTVLVCEDVARTRNCALAGVVLNRLPGASEDHGNARYLRERLDVPVWDTAAGRWLDAAAERALLARVLEPQAPS